MFATGSNLAIVAHQGGWDEVLLIGGPIIVIAGLLILAKKRVDSALPEEQESDAALDRSSDGSETTD